MSDLSPIGPAVYPASCSASFDAGHPQVTRVWQRVTSSKSSAAPVLVCQTRFRRAHTVTRIHLYAKHYHPAKLFDTQHKWRATSVAGAAAPSSAGSSSSLPRSRPWVSQAAPERHTVVCGVHASRGPVIVDARVAQAELRREGFLLDLLAGLTREALVIYWATVPVAPTPSVAPLPRSIHCGRFGEDRHSQWRRVSACAACEATRSADDAPAAHSYLPAVHVDACGPRITPPRH
jgi:hypothetical protein